MSLFSLADRVAVITGSTRGIGRAIAERMAEAGARVVVSSRKRDACDEVVAAIEAAHGRGRAIAIPANISSKDELRNLVDETTKRLGRIDVLVCNAASNPYYGPMAGLDDAAFRKILENNVLSNHWLIQFAAPQMVARRDGSIVIVSSIGGLRGSEVLGAYCVSKAADLQLARNLALEYGPHGVRVNCIAPETIMTERNQRQIPDEVKEQLRLAHPIRRLGVPDDVARAALFLASGQSAWVSGITLDVAGGSVLA